MAAGLAHELNNPLTTILVNSVVLRDMLGGRYDHDEADEMLSEIECEALRISHVVDSLILATRGDEQYDGHSKVDAATIASSALSSEVPRQGIQTIVDLQPGLVVGADGPHLRLVFVNLVRNAMQALAGSARPRVVRVSGRRRNARVLITVQDNGMGMTADQRNKAFHPFYTTGRPGRLGLGLSVAVGILRSYRGSIRLTSEPCRGSRFTVDMPAVLPPTR